MKANAMKFALVLIAVAAAGCSTIERAQERRDADPAAYEQIDPNAHYHSHDRADWVEGS